MDFYKNPSLVESVSDPTYSLWSYYMKNSTYDWQVAPDWLENQLRYPENLFELQLEANYKYHVQDLTTWKRGDDFHERPENGDLFYIETNLGDGIEYVGLDLVEYRGTEARTLAGMYIIRHGINFGEAIFYHTRNTTDNLIVIHFYILLEGQSFIISQLIVQLVVYNNLNKQDLLKLLQGK
jgi:hypothetical protein